VRVRFTTGSEFEATHARPRRIQSEGLYEGRDVRRTSATRRRTREMAVDKDEQFVREHIGDPADIVRELQEFGRSTRSLSNQYPDLVDRYPGQWVALHNGKVRAHGRTFQDVMQKIDQEGLPRARTVVRFIDQDDRIMIL
jgi:hypothetical protein